MTNDISEAMLKGQPKQETLEKFYLALAASIVSWQRIEYALYEIAKLATSPQQSGAFSSGYHALQHTGTQLRFADAALDFWFVAYIMYSAPLKAIWLGENKGSGKGLYKKIDTELSTRNCLAHFSAITEPQKILEHEKIYLEPSFLDTRFVTGTKKKSRYTTLEITAAGERFRVVANEMRAFAQAMVKVEAQQKESLARLRGH